MIVIVAGTVSVEPANRGAAQAAIRAMVAATRREPGCVSYDFSADFDDPARFHVREVWADEAALDAHFATPHVADFMRAARAFGVKSMDIQRYYVERVAPLR